LRLLYRPSIGEEEKREFYRENKGRFRFLLASALRSRKEGEVACCALKRNPYQKRGVRG